jgi:hypothetical protein
MQVLGKSADDLLPLLSQGEEGLRALLERGRELNPITQELAEKADLAKDQLAELQLVSTGLGAELATELLPSIIDITKAMTEAAKESGILKGIWVGMGGVAAHALGLDDVSQAKDRLAEVNGEIKDITDRLRGGGVSTTSDGIRGLTEKETQDMLQRLKSLGMEAANLKQVIDPISQDNSPKPKKLNNTAINSVLNKDKKTSTSGSSIYSSEMKDLASLILEIEKLDDVEQGHTQALQLKLDAYSRLDPALNDYLNKQIQLSRAAEQLEAFEKAAAAGDDSAAEALEEERLREQEGLDKRSADYYEFSERMRVENEDLNISLIENDRKRAKAQLDLEHERSVARINGMMLEGEQAQALLDQ